MGKVTASSTFPCDVLAVYMAFFILQARKIAKAGQTYARDNLMPQHAYCYTYLLFKVSCCDCSSLRASTTVSVEFAISRLIEFIHFNGKFKLYGNNSIGDARRLECAVCAVDLRQNSTT